MLNRLLAQLRDHYGDATLATVGFGWLLLIWCWPVSHLTMTVDDAWYYVVTARRFANGEGFTFDGINETNGFHPLWLFALSGIACLRLELEPMVRLALSVQVVLVVVSFRWLSASLKAPQLGQTIAAVMLLNFYAGKIVLCGMESATVLFSMALAIRFMATKAPSWQTGLALAAVMLARLDLIPWVAVFIALSKSEKRTNMIAAAVWPLFGWVLFSALRFGNPIPVSAAVKAHEVLHPTIGALVLAIGLCLTVVGARLSADGSTPPNILQSCVVAGGAWARGLVVPEIWYLVPALLFAFISTTRLAQQHRRTAVGLILAAHVAVSSWGWQHRLNPDSWSVYTAARATGIWIATNTPKTAVISGWDCGIVAAYSDRRFLQLEGLMGSWDYYNHWLFTIPTFSWLAHNHVSCVVESSPRPSNTHSWPVVYTRAYHFRQATGPTHPFSNFHVACVPQ